MKNAKSVHLFLLDGDTDGRIKATLDNWNGVTYKLPRTTLSSSGDRDHLKQAGVYLLFGTDEDELEKVYIGQARKRKNENGVLGRIKEHLGAEKLEYWTHAVAIITSDDSFGPTEISYLENRFARMASEANRFQIANDIEPPLADPPEEKQAELDGFIKNARTVISALGYRVFEPLDGSELQSEIHKFATKEPDEEPVLYLKQAGCTASGRRTSDGFVVFAGSQLRDNAQFPPSTPPAAFKARQVNRTKIQQDFLLSEDVLLKSPSGAAEFVIGGSVDGRSAWKDESGRKLSEIEAGTVNRLTTRTGPTRSQMSPPAPDPTNGSLSEKTATTLSIDNRHMGRVHCHCAKEFGRKWNLRPNLSGSRTLENRLVSRMASNCS